ncbi:MAG: bifunctional homocysteine S-methyltransferase/methylenetetrahydrofolate reductase [Acidobacteria bacterium]|nr:bifunctional homocysteine S-methyltransferase/methylenetetrahydrofolate reductase [Acidobacteriota bacterium]
MPPFLQALAERVVLFDGGTGTEIYNRGVFLNRCYEELNLTRPELVEEVHRSFIQAGSDATETNTFGANRARLEPRGLGDQVREINREGARVARRAAGSRAWVAGAVGPLGIRLEPWGPTTFDEAVALFQEQIEALAEGGVDLLVLETFSDLVELQAAVRGARRAADLPVIAMMTVNEEGRTPEGVPPEWIGQKLDTSGADVVGVNCSVGPAPMLSVIEAMAAVTSRPLAAMPNAGIPRSVEGRLHYLTSPAYMARYARRFVQAGARVVGGCCGVTPDHVRAMREVLAPASAERIVPRVEVLAPKVRPREPAPAHEKSKLAAKIGDGRLVMLVESPPPRGWDTAELLAGMRAMAEAGLDGALVPDDPRTVARMSSIAFAGLLAREGAHWGSELEAVLEYSCRDRNLLGMQSDLLGAHALGLRNLVLVTGRAPRPGEESWATPVFDVDAIGLTNMVFRLNHGLDVGDNPIGEPTRFYAGCEALPASPQPDEEVRRFEWKVDAGAEFAVAGPVFDVNELGAFLEQVAAVRIPVLAVVRPLRSAREAEFLNEELPGVRVPPAVIERVSAARTPEAEEQAGLAIAAELVESLAAHVEGICLSGPLARDPRLIPLVRGIVGREVAVRRRFPGRPGIKGGAEGTRYGTPSS